MLEIYKAFKEAVPEVAPLLASKPSNHYKVFRIPKRSIGFRTIAQPTPRVKDIQRCLVAFLQKHLAIHSSATAYVKGMGVRENALVHCKSTYLLKMDLEDFFNSITPKIFFRALSKQEISLSSIDTNFLSEFLFWNRSKRANGALVLSVGAPSSPFISNVVMYSFDVRISQICEKLGVKYSRYADDITFSTNKKNILFSMPDVVEKALYLEFGKKIKLNKRKTVFSSKAHNRHVTGVTLSNDNKISLGRERKRYISSLIYSFKENRLSRDDILELKGLLGFSNYIEPDFLERMKRKYGLSVFEELNIYE